MDVMDVFKQACELPERDRAEMAGIPLETQEGDPDAAAEQAWSKEIGRTE